MAECHVGLLIIGVGNNESTTKVFDYIALSLPILILTSGELYQGTIHNVTKDYPNVFWCHNKEPEITASLLLIKEARLENAWDESRVRQFSRAQV